MPARRQPDRGEAAGTIQLRNFCRSVAEIQWLLVALVLLYLFLAGDPTDLPLAVLTGIGVYFVISLGANYLTLFDARHRWLIALHTLLMIAFVTWLIHQTDGIGGPLVSLYLLAIITSALTLGKIATLLEVAVVAACYFWLFRNMQGSDVFAGNDLAVAGAHMMMFLLVGYLTTMLAEAIHSAHERLEALPHLEQQVSAATDRLKRAVDQSTDAFIEMDSAGRITEWNRRAESMLGWSRDEAIGQPLRDLIVPEKYRQAHDRGVKRFLETGKARTIDRRVEMEALTRDGELLPVELLIHDVQMPDQYYFDAFLHDVSERREQRSQLLHRAHVDPVTQLANRHAFEERLEAVLNREDTNADFLLVIVDLDGFKEVNDNHGHDAGDRLLRQVGRRLTANVRSRDLVARLGGDEFAVLMEQVKAAEEELAPIADKLLSALAEPYRIEQAEVTVTASLGLALPRDAPDADELRRRADKAMYRAKHAGKNRFHIAEA